jgi:hypothetical protein
VRAAAEKETEKKQLETTASLPAHSQEKRRNHDDI